MLSWVLFTFLNQAFCMLIEESNTSTLKDIMYFFKKKNIVVGNVQFKRY